MKRFMKISVLSLLLFLGVFNFSYANSDTDLVQSTDLSLNAEAIFDQIYDVGQQEYYKIILPTAGKVELSVTNANSIAQTTEPQIVVYDELFNTTYADFKVKSIGVPATEVTTLHLYAGTYYVRVNANGTSGYSVGLQASYMPVDSNVSAAYENPAGALTAALGGTYTGIYGQDVGFNYYKLVVPEKSRISVTSYQSDSIVFCFMQSNADEEISRQQFDAPSGTVTEELEAGVYYLRFGGNALFWHSSPCVYKFTVTQVIPPQQIGLETLKVITAGDSVQLSATVLPANTTDKSVTWETDRSYIATVSDEGVVKGIDSGKATITVIANDDDDVKAECEVIVKPSKPKMGAINVYKSSYSKKRSVYFSPESSSSYDGYKIKYSKKKNMKKAKATNKSNVQLKKGTYYFQVQTYVEVDGKKYYSEWSNVKKRKIK